MSILNEYRSTKETLKELEQRLSELSGDSRLEKELEFEQMLREIMTEYNKSLHDIVNIIDPDFLKSATQSSEKPTRKPRRTKRYLNPHTGAVIETKGANHKELKEWKAQWGQDTVESWFKFID